MRYTLKQFLDHYGDIRYIQIKYGVHLISIDLEAKGSYRLYKALENEKYYLILKNKNYLHLDIDNGRR